MALIPCAELTAAHWIASSGRSWPRLVSEGPPGYPGYARLRYVPDPVYKGQTENDLVYDAEPAPETDQLRLATETLLPCTDTPEEGYALVWEGWGEGEFPAQVRRTPRLRVPERAYYLLKVQLSEFVRSEDSWEVAGRIMPPPAFLWPEDRAWCITSDIDPHWAGIGTSHTGLRRLLGEGRLDVVELEPEDEIPYYY